MNRVTIDGIELWNDLDAVQCGLLGWLADTEHELSNADLNTDARGYWQQQKAIAERAIAMVTKWQDIAHEIAYPVAEDD